MKCVFIAAPYLFSVQYHAHGRVAEHQRQAWTLALEGFEETFRMHERANPGQALDDLCALFVPARMASREAQALVAAFNAANPGVIPRHLLPDHAEAPPNADPFHFGNQAPG